ncbi:MAG: hypothetical protein ACHRXM_04815 [Isosphaerales bacterium]
MDSDHPICNGEIEREFDLTALECRLGAWQPSASSLDRGRMLYHAGRAAVQAEGRGRPWRLATAALGLLALGLGGLLVHERSQRHALVTARALAPRISRPELARQAGEYVFTAPGETRAIEPPAPSSYFVLTSHLAALALEPASPTTGRQGGPPPGPDPPAIAPHPAPLRSRDFNRILEL